MFKLSEDIVLELKNKYPNICMESFIHHLFHAIMEKTIKDGSCHIREFGKFSCFQTMSARTNTSVIRFKYCPSSTFIKKLNKDRYLKNIIPVKANVPFTSKHESICNNKKDIYLKNKEAQTEAHKLGKEQTTKNVSKQTILDLLKED